MNNLKLIISFFWIISIFSNLEAKTVVISEIPKIEEGVVLTKTIRNLSEIDFFWPGPITIIHGNIYLMDVDLQRVIKLSLNGLVTGRFGRKGQGPKELLGLSGVSQFGDDIAITGSNKVIICSKELQFIKEVKLKKRFHNLILGANSKIYFYNNYSWSNYYFTKYTKHFKRLGKFAVKKPGAKEIDDSRINFNNYKHSWDCVRRVLYVPKENGIWVSFKNRYDLRYYRNEKVAVEIKAKSKSFSKSDDVFSGVKVKAYSDYSLAIGKDGNLLYYCTKQDDGFYCDVFDLSDKYRLKRRIKFPHSYSRMAYSHGATFYGLRYSADEEDILLDKIQIK